MESTNVNTISNTDNPTTPTTTNPTTPTTPEATNEAVKSAYEKLSTILNSPLNTEEIEFLNERKPTAEQMEALCEYEITKKQLNSANVKGSFYAVNSRLCLRNPIH